MNSNVIYWARDFDNNLGELRAPAYEGDAGMDVVTILDANLRPHTISQIPIGIRIVPPPDTCYTFMTRSSAVVHGLFVVPTLIDEGYRGPLFLFVMNTLDGYVAVPKGTRIAQVLLLPNTLLGSPEIKMVAMHELPIQTSRGTNRFGSSGGGI